MLVLGAVRIFQPVHGYLVRRELLSWHAEHWAHLNPGSVYNALRGLTREGYLEEAGTETEGGRPARTTYRLTGDGETEFLGLLRTALWNVEPFEPDLLMAAWGLAWALRRTEVVAALEHRLEQIAAAGVSSGYAIEEMSRNPDMPAHVAEHYRLVQARLEGEGDWIRELLPRLQAGQYRFEGEPDPAV